MKVLEMAEGRGSNPYYAGNFDGESDELRDLRLTLVAERDALKAELERIKALKPVAVRYDFDGYGWQYIDSGSGSDWLTRHKDGEGLYTLGSKT